MKVATVLRSVLVLCHASSGWGATSGSQQLCRYFTRSMAQGLVWPPDFLTPEYTTAKIIASLECGNMSLLNLLVTQYTDWLPDGELMTFIVENGLCDAAELVFRKKNRLQPSMKSLDVAAERGHVDMLKIIAANCQRARPSADGTNRAMVAGQLGVIQWIDEIAPDYFNYDKEAISAAQNGHLNILKWIFEEKDILPSYRGMNFAAQRGHLEVVEWLYSMDPFVVPTLTSIEVAAERGHLLILKWFWDHFKAVPTMHQLVFQGLFKTADWLHSQSDGKYPDQNVMNEAVADGRGHVLAWIWSKNAYLTPNVESILRAIVSGHEGSLFWLLQHNSTCLFDTTIFDYLAVYNRWLFIDNLLELNVIWAPSQSNIDLVVKSGRVATLAKLLGLPQAPNPSRESINSAAKLGHVESLYLIHDCFHDALPDMPTIKSLYTLGQLGVIRLLYTVLLDFKTTRSQMNAAAQNGHVELLEYCHSRQPRLLPRKKIVYVTNNPNVQEWYNRVAALMKDARSEQGTRENPAQAKQSLCTQSQQSVPLFSLTTSDKQVVSAIVVDQQLIQNRRTLDPIVRGSTAPSTVALIGQPPATRCAYVPPSRVKTEPKLALSREQQQLQLRQASNGQNPAAFRHISQGETKARLQLCPPAQTFGNYKQ